MKNKIVLILVMIMLMFSIQLNLGQVHAQTNKSEDLFKDLEIRQLMKEYKIPGLTIALIDNGEIVSLKAYGYARVDENIAMDVTTVCRTQSISKSVTAWGVMRLVESGKIDLDDPVTNYLAKDDLSIGTNDLKDVTIRQLLSNSSGLSTGTVGVHYDPNKKIPTLRENISKEIKFIEQPNTKFIYSNTGFNLLELVIENVTNEDFNSYMTKNVLKPLGMDTATYEMTEEVFKKMPYGYDLKTNEVYPYVYPEKASGGLYATAEDIARFVNYEMVMYHQTEVLDERTIKVMQSPQVKTSDIYSLVADDYGLGHFIEYFDDQKAVFHGGQGHGWMTHYHFVPSDGNGIVILTNAQSSWPLISIVLKQWSQHYGYELKMSRIALGITILKGIVFLIFIYAGWLIFKIFKHKNNPLIDKNSLKQVFQVLIATIILFLLLWSLTMDYVFLAAVFPKMYQWLRFSLLVLSIVMIVDYIVINQHKMIV